MENPSMNKHAIIDGCEYSLIETVSVLGSDDTVILCRDGQGKQVICSVALWISAAPKQAAAPVHAGSAAQEKIELFMSLFRGREDVYARRYHSIKSGKGGYAPVCKNEWVPGVCDKKANKCTVCPNRAFMPLSIEAVRKHLIGGDEHCRDVVGVYPLLPGDTTFFLAADFDGENWREDVAAFRTVCSDFGLTPGVERSRSGDGAHSWFFFTEPVPAADARKLGSGLLTCAMERRHELSFNSYDRLFPSQDAVPKGGLGNLIALPFQGQAQRLGNSLFIDEGFLPYSDQWAFLSTLPKITPDKLAQHISAVCLGGDMGELMEDMEPKPWEKKRSTKKLTRFDFPETVKLTQANMLYVEKAGISQSALNFIRRLAAFRNPDFYKSQAMRLPIYNKPRIIDCSEEHPAHLAIPRGCIDALQDLLNAYSVPYSIADERCRGSGIDVSFSGALRSEQLPAAEALLARDMGVLSATTAFGKTVIGAYLIGQRKVNTLILVHSSALLVQWKAALEQFLVINEELPEQPKKRGRKKKLSLIGQLGAGKNTLGGIVDIAIIQSLFEGEEKAVKELVADYGMVICDECHHIAAFTFEKVLRAATAKYVYGLSATPSRQDGHHPIIFMQCGPTRYIVDAKAQADMRNFEHFVIPRFTKTRLPDTEGIQRIYADVAQNEARNACIVRDALAALDEGRTPILLTQRREHAIALAGALREKTANVLLLLGSDSQKEKREKLALLKAVPSGDPLVVVATGKYIGEGFDEPRLDTLLLAMPVAWKGTLAQYAGRLHRNYEGKHEARIYDYVDTHIPVLERMYQKRLRGYGEIGYRVKSDGQDEVPGLIFDSQSFYTAFANDLTTAARDILIISPFVRKARVTTMRKLLTTPLLAGVKLTVVTRPAEDYKPEQQSAVAAIIDTLRFVGVTVLLRSNIHQKYAVIDQSIVWYGSINFLSFGKSEESVMRFESSDIAGELLDAVRRG